MKKRLFLVALWMVLWSCKEQGPVRLISAPEVWQQDQKPVVVLNGVRTGGINHVSFWYDTVIKGGMRPSDTLVFPSLQTVSADFEPGSRHRLYIDFFRDTVHVQRIIVNFRVAESKGKQE